MGVFPLMWSVCLFTVIRSAGTTVGWINSSLLLQKFSSPDMLGRVSSMDVALGFLCESLSALICGFLQDVGASEIDVVYLVFLSGVVLIAFWSWHHIRCGRDGVFSDVAIAEGGFALSDSSALVE
jgi:cyanate permease